MKGVLIGDSQLKYVSSSRLQFAENVVRTCTFSVGGATAASLLSKVQQWRLRPVEFVVICVGGNDLSNGRDPWDICRDILDLVKLMRTLASTVFVYKVLPRCGANAQAEARRRVLNRKLARGARNMEDVVVINSDMFFLKKKQPKRHYFAEDGYHMSRDMGVHAFARLLKAAALKRLGAMYVSSRSRPEVCRWTRCEDCNAKGHRTRQCYAFRKGH